MTRIHLYDTTLCDGARAEDLAFTLNDILRVAAELADCGMS